MAVETDEAVVNQVDDHNSTNTTARDSTFIPPKPSVNFTGNRAQRRAAMRISTDTNNNKGSAIDNEANQPLSITSIPTEHEVGPKTLKQPDNISNTSTAMNHDTMCNESAIEMTIDDDISHITHSLQKTSLHVPPKISFGRRKGNYAKLT